MRAIEYIGEVNRTTELNQLCKVLNDELIMHITVNDYYKSTEGDHWEINSFYGTLCEDLGAIIAAIKEFVCDHIANPHAEIWMKHYLGLTHFVEPNCSCELFIQLQYLKSCNDCILQNLRNIQTMDSSIYDSVQKEILMSRLIAYHERIGHSLNGHLK